MVKDNGLAVTMTFYNGKRRDALMHKQRALHWHQTTDSAKTGCNGC